MNRAALISTMATFLFVAPALAQNSHSGQSPYTGLQHRDIKALSAEQIAGLRAGKGLAFALPAELNGVPGPAHVLELADRLQLSSEQISRITGLKRKMTAEAQALGEHLIAAEAALDQLFAHGLATAEKIAEATAVAGQAQANLRNAHLQYHLFTLEVLTPAQTAAYKSARGYASH